MKILLNTLQPNAAASAMYISGFKSSPNFTFNDWNNYSKYDLVLFMTYEEDLDELIRVKKKHPKLIIGLVDPRGNQIHRALDYINFFIVDSIEMYDYFLKYNKKIFIYYEYTKVKRIKRVHSKKQQTIIGYHGNKLHLEGMKYNITEALDKLGEKYDLEFWALYNWENLGRAKYGIPKTMKVKHIQWSLENFNNILSKVDIGIVPGSLPIRNLKRIKLKAEVDRFFFNENNDDYLIRFKMPTNPGRIVCFARLGIPVVSDMYPSALQTISNCKDGFIADSTGAWYRYLEILILNHKLRQEYSDNLISKIDPIFSYDLQNKNLIKNISNYLLKSSTSEKIDIIESTSVNFRNIPNFFTEMIKRKFKYRFFKLYKKIFSEYN